MLVLSVSNVYKTGDFTARFPPPEGLLAQKNKGALCDMNSLFCRKKFYYSDGIQTFWTRCSCFCFVFLPAAITRCYYSLSSVIRFLRPNKRKLPNLTVIKNTEQREGTFRICARYPLNQLKFKDLAGESGHVVVLGERIDRCVLFCLKFSKASNVDKFLIRCSAFHPIQGLF